jgi:hypothetical protein
MINFPDSPTLNQIFQGLTASATWNGTVAGAEHVRGGWGLWRAAGLFARRTACHDFDRLRGGNSGGWYATGGQPGPLYAASRSLLHLSVHSLVFSTAKRDGHLPGAKRRRCRRAARCFTTTLGHKVTLVAPMPTAVTFDIHQQSLCWDRSA